MNVLSLFDGMSCGQIALERAGIKVEKYYASEIKLHAIKVTQHNYPKTIQLGDVTKLKGEDIPGRIDLLIGGSPCQDFSQANKIKDGLKGTKSNLFYEYYRLLQEVNPKYYLLENVEMDTKEYAEISKLLGTFPIKINSELVAPQLRSRVYWTNIGPEFIDLLGERHCDIRQPKDKKDKLSNILQDGYTEKNKARCLLESDSRPLSTPVKMFHRYYTSGFTTLIFNSKAHLEDCKKYYNENYNGMAAEDIKCDSNVFDGVRYLTQNELEKCQTIPSGYTNILNRNDAASLLGDGWTVDVIAHIFKHLK